MVVVMAVARPAVLVMEPRHHSVRLVDSLLDHRKALLLVPTLSAL